MTKILTHIHLFYPEMWTELKACLQNIGNIENHLFITMVKDNEDVRRDIHEHYANASVQIVENKGYDVGPFIQIINQANLDDYDYIIKLHSKRDMPHGSLLSPYHVGGTLWRDYLLAFIKTPANFTKTIQAFQNDPKLGMAAHYRLIIEHEKNDKDAHEFAANYFAKLNIPPHYKDFVAGTMFIARASLFTPLKNLGLSINDFTTPIRGEKTSLAHSLERFMGWMIGAQSHSIQDVFTNKNTLRKERYIRPLRHLKLFLYRSKITRNGKHLIKICKIPIRL